MPLWLRNGASGFFGTLAIANGGTGGVTAKAAAAALSAGYVVGHSGVQSPITGTLVRTTLATVTIPAGAMGANGRVRATALWSVTNSANNKVLGVRFNGAAGTLYANDTVTAVVTVRKQCEIANRNATNSQVGAANGLAGGWGSTSGAIVTSAVDTTAAVDIVFEATLANTGETIALEGYLVELFAGAGT